MGLLRAATMICVFLLCACQPQVEAVYLQERATLADVKTVQKWVQVAMQPETIVGTNAPSLIPLIEGDYRMYWTDARLRGIGSATTPDGILFNLDEGARLTNAGAGQPDCVVSKPFVIQTADGYRMYYQAQADPCDDRAPDEMPANSRIMSAFSLDGRLFEREAGIRVDVGASSGLSAAGHGRVIQQDDGNYRMYFTARSNGETEGLFVASASSVDSLNWQVDTSPILVGAHDPTAIQIEDTIYLYISYQSDNFLLLESNDGIHFSPVSWLEFYDASGQRIGQFGDVDVFETMDGKLLMYGSGQGMAGVGIFRQEAS